MCNCVRALQGESPDLSRAQINESEECCYGLQQKEFGCKKQGSRQHGAVMESESHTHCNAGSSYEAHYYDN